MTMYKYNICTAADKEIFERQCRALEMHIPGMEKLKRLQDVDGTEIQNYLLRGKPISVHNDMQIDAVYIESGVNIEPFFQQKKSSSGAPAKRNIVIRGRKQGKPVFLAKRVKI